MQTTERNGQQAAEAPSPNGANGHAPAPSPNGENGAAPGANGRAEGGRFAKGNPGGPGNPFARAVGARRKALLDAVSPEDVGRVARLLYEQALAGDTAAAKVLLAYVVGRPAAAADPDRENLDELRLMMDGPLKAQLVLHAIQGAGAEAALDFLREKLAGTTDESIIDTAKGGGAARLLDLITRTLAERAKET